MNERYTVVNRPHSRQHYLISAMLSLVVFLVLSYFSDWQLLSLALNEIAKTKSNELRQKKMRLQSLSALNMSTLMYVDKLLFNYVHYRCKKLGHSQSATNSDKLRTHKR